MVEASSDAATTDDGVEVGAGGVAEPAVLPRRALRTRFGRLAVGLVSIGVLYLGVTFWQVWHAARTDSPRASDAIVVLGAAQYDGRPSRVLQARLDTALALYRNGMAPLIVTTGANQAGDRFTEADSGYDYLRDHGVPASALLSIPLGTNTWEELSATAHSLVGSGRSKVLLVSDPYHAYRVNRVADEVGLDGAVVSAPGSAPLGRLVRETAGASIGRFIGYRALARLG